MKDCETDHTGFESWENDPEVRLMLAFQRGNEEAFVQLYRSYRDRVINFSRRIIGNVAQGEEAAQEVFLKIYRFRGRYVPKARFSTFVFRLATNHCLGTRLLRRG